MYRKHIAVFVGAFALISTAFPVYADVITSQSDFSTAGSATSTVNKINLGTGLVGNVSKIITLARKNSAEATGILILKECSDAAFTVSCTLIEESASNGSFGTAADIFWVPDANNITQASSSFAYYRICTSLQTGCGSVQTTSYSLNAVKYYQLWIYPLNNSFFIYGNPSGVPAYYLYSPAGDHTQILSLDTPLNGSTTPTADITLRYTYYYAPAAGTYDRTGITIRDLTTQQTIQSAVYSPQSGTHQISDFEQLQANHLYEWSAYMYNSSSVLTPLIRSSTFRFSTVSAQYNTVLLQSGTSSVNYSLPLPEITDANASSSLGINLGSFQNIASFFAGRAPWGYLFEISDIYRDAATTSAGFSGITFDFVDSGLSTATRAWLPDSIDVFSVDTVTYYLNGSLLDSLNFLASAAIYVTLMAAYFTRIKNLMV